MEDAGDHHIALANHPLVAPDDGIPPGHLFQRRVGGAVIAGGVDLPVKIGQHQDQLNVGIGFLLPPNSRRSETIKGSIAAEVEGVRAALDQ